MVVTEARSPSHAPAAVSDLPQEEHGARRWQRLQAGLLGLCVLEEAEQERAAREHYYRRLEDEREMRRRMAHEDEKRKRWAGMNKPREKVRSVTTTDIYGMMHVDVGIYVVMWYQYTA